MRNLRNFGITFAVSLLILGIAAVFACGFVSDTVSSLFQNKDKDLNEILSPSDQTDDQGNASDDDRFSRELTGESFTWLMIGTDYRPAVYDNYYPTEADLKELSEDDMFGVLGEDYRITAASSIAVVRADVEKREYVIMTIPSITKVDTPSGSHTLGDIYTLYGISYLEQKIESMTGLGMDYCTVLNITELTAVINLIGAVPVELPIAIYTDGKNFMSAPESAADTSTKETKKDEDTETTVYELELKAGNNTVASKAIGVLLYQDWTDGVTDEMSILGSFVKGVLTNLSGYSDSTLASIYTSGSGKFKYIDITADAIAAEAEVIRGFSWFLTTNTTYPGRFVEAKGTTAAYYKPDINEAVEFFANYR